MFPQPTHGSGLNGLKPLTSAEVAISKIPHDASLHDPRKLRESYARSNTKKRTSGGRHLPLRRVICTKGSEELHWDGDRGYTPREQLCLQGFPQEYHLCSSREGKDLTQSEAYRMIGNAVPPFASTPFFASVKKALEASRVELGSISEVEGNS